MKPLARVLTGVLLVAAIFAATGFVLTKTRRMSLFLEARDRIERGEDRREVTAALRAQIDWEREPDGVARRIAAAAPAWRAGGRDPAVFRAGAWALLVGPAGGHLLERTSGGWREIR